MVKLFGKGVLVRLVVGVFILIFTSVLISGCSPEPKPTETDLKNAIGTTTKIPTDTTKESESGTTNQPLTAGIQATSYKLLGVVREEEYKAGQLPGTGEQLMHSVDWSTANPDVIYMAQDMGGPWRSNDGGLSWQPCLAEGLYTNCCISIKSDPVDEDIVYVSMNSRNLAEIHPFMGLYRSTDGGATFDWVIKIDKIGELRSQNHTITYDPNSIGDSCAKVWYCAFGPNTYNTYYESVDHGLWQSTDAGITWSKLGELPEDPFGLDIYNIKVNPANSNQIFLTSTAGFFRLDLTENGYTTTTLSGANGLPKGAYHTLELSADGTDMTVTAIKNGIWRCQTAGGQGTWTQILNWSLIRSHEAAQSDRNTMIAIAATTEGDIRRTSNALDANPKWEGKYNITPRAKFDAWHIAIGRSSPNRVLIHPTDSNTAFALAGTGHMYRSTDKGENWVYSDDFFTGTIVQRGFQVFDAFDPNRWLLPCTDIGIYETQNGGISYIHHRPAPKGAHNTVATLAVQPVKENAVILCGVDTVSKQFLRRSTDGGATWTSPLEGHGRRHFIGWHMQNPNIAYTGQEYSTDAGETWTTIEFLVDNKANIVAMSPSNSDIIYAIDNMGTRKMLFKSTDRGANWTLIAEATDWIFRAHDQLPTCPIAVHPTNPHEVWLKGTGGVPAKLDTNTGKWTNFTDIFKMTSSEDNFVSEITFDPRYPEVAYVLLARTGVPSVFRTVDNGATWQDITFDLPNTKKLSILVSPHTGDMFVTSAVGTRVLPPPYAQEGTIYESLKYENNVWTGK